MAARGVTQSAKVADAALELSGGDAQLVVEMILEGGFRALQLEEGERDCSRLGSHDRALEEHVPSEGSGEGRGEPPRAAVTSARTSKRKTINRFK